MGYGDGIRLRDRKKVKRAAFDLARRGVVEVAILSLAAVGGGLLGLAKYLSR